MTRRTALLLAVVALAGCGGAEDRAAELVPADAFVYVHVVNDGQLVQRLGEFDFAGELLTEYGEVEAWLGDEAAFAMTPRGTLVLLAVDDEKGAREWAVANGGELTDGFVVLGDPGEGKRLADEPGYVDAEVSDDASVRAWITGLPPLFGDGPVVADLALTEDGAHVQATRLGGAADTADFAPTLVDGAAQDAFAYVSVRGLSTLGAVLPAAAGAAAPELAGLLGPLLEQLDGEVAITAAPAGDEPAITLSARVDDPDAARAALAGLQGALATALTEPGEATGQIPVFVERDLGEGLSGFALTLAGGGELVYAFAGDRVAVSNGDAGVSRALTPEAGLERAEAFAATVPELPETAQALAFLASSQLLELADQAGLDASPAYVAARADLARIRALGAVVRRQGNDTTLDIDLLIE